MTTTRRRLLLLLLVAFPVALILVATAQGIGVSIDSVSYIATAKSFAAGNGLLSYDGLPLTIFPPGYPIVLGLLIAAGLSVNIAAIAINVLSVVLLVLCSYELGRRLLGSPNQALFTTAFVALSASTVRTNSYAWSEPVFTVLVLAALILLVIALERSSLGWRSAVAVALLVSVATTFRFVGIALVPVAMLGAYIVWRRTLRPTSAAVRSLLLAAGSLLGFAVVAARNVTFGSGPMGERYPGSRTIEGGLATAFRALGESVAPSQTTSLTAFVGVVVVVLLVAGIWVALLQRNAPMLVVATFVVVYWAAIVVSQSTTRVDEAGERFAAPAFVAVVILGAYAIRELAAGAARQLEESELVAASKARATFRVVGAVVLVGILGLSVMHGVRFARMGHQDGLVGFGSLDSALIRAVAGAVGVASNDPWAIWWARQAGPVVDLPVSPTEWPQARVDADIERLVSAVVDGRVDTVVVFDNGRPFLPLDELAAHGLALIRSAEFTDGTLYSVASTS